MQLWLVYSCCAILQISFTCNLELCKSVPAGNGLKWLWFIKGNTYCWCQTCQNSYTPCFWRKPKPLITAHCGVKDWVLIMKEIINEWIREWSGAQPRSQSGHLMMMSHVQALKTNVHSLTFKILLMFIHCLNHKAEAFKYKKNHPIPKK